MKIEDVDLTKFNEIQISPNEFAKLKEHSVDVCPRDDIVGTTLSALSGIPVCVNSLIPDNQVFLIGPRDPNDPLKIPEMVIIEITEEPDESEPTETKPRKC